MSMNTRVINRPLVIESERINFDTQNQATVIGEKNDKNTMR